MPDPNIIITRFDKERLGQVMAEATDQAIDSDEHLEAFRRKFERATIVAPEEIPADVVTMNSTVYLYDMDFDVTDSYTLVYPDDADIFSNRLSILNPMAMAILGRRPGEVARWQNASGEHLFELKELAFQPEREGLMNL